MVYIMTTISADRNTDVYRFKTAFLISTNRLMTEPEEAQALESAAKYLLSRG